MAFLQRRSPGPVRRSSGLRRCQLFQDEVHVLCVIFDLLGPAAHGFERVPGPGCREEYVVRTFPGVVRDGFLSPGQGFVELPVQDELIQTVKKDLSQCAA